MKFNVKSYVAGILTAAIIGSATIAVAGAQIKKTVDVYYNGIKICIDGKNIHPKDANGNSVDPFIMDGTTYLPVRAVADAIGYGVNWDANTQTVSLNKNHSSVELQSGMYIVGKDIPAGLYKLVSDEEDFGFGYWERCKDAYGTLNSIIANDNFETFTYVEVKEGEYFNLLYCKGYLQE